MVTDGMYTAVVDRFEEEQAVLLLEAGEETVGELLVERNELPEDGRQVNAVLSVEVTDDDLVEATFEAQETEERSDRSQRRFDELSRRPPSRDEDDES